MIGDKLRGSRLRAGLSLRALEDKIGKKVTAQAIGKYERGDMQPQAQILDILASALGVTRDFLETEQSIELGTIDFRENTIRSKSEERSVENTIYNYVRNYLFIEELLDVVAEKWEKPRYYPLPVTDILDAELAAHKLRDDWQIGDDPIPNFSEILEERGFKIILHELPKSIAGVTCFVNTNRGWNVPVILISDKITGERQRFTIAHEIGHLLLENTNKLPNFEKVCDMFAGAFLMPKRFMWTALGKTRNNIDIRELISLKKFLGVSVQAIVFRCKQIGIITDYTYRQLFKEFSHKGWLTPPYNEPEKMEIEKPLRFKRLCLRAYAENIITKEKAAELLGNDFNNNIK